MSRVELAFPLSVISMERTNNVFECGELYLPIIFEVECKSFLLDIDIDYIVHT